MNVSLTITNGKISLNWKKLEQKTALKCCFNASFFRKVYFKTFYAYVNVSWILTKGLRDLKFFFFHIMCCLPNGFFFRHKFSSTNNLICLSFLQRSRIVVEIISFIPFPTNFSRFSLYLRDFWLIEFWFRVMNFNTFYFEGSNEQNFKFESE